MVNWSALLSYEAEARAAIAAQSNAVGVTLFDKFEANPGGQTKFFEHTPIGQLFDKPHRWAGLVGGIGSGKSYVGAAWTISRSLLQPQARGLITANTFGQLSRSSLMTLAEVCRKFNVPLEPYRESIEDQALAIANMQRCYIGEERAFLYALSMNTFMGRTQAARGLQVRYAWIDEAAFADEKAFLTLDGRLGRGPGDMKGEGIITTSPNGFNWLYSRFADPQRGPERAKLYVLISCSTRENVKHLGEEYVIGLQANYTDELAAQELEGAFINTTTGQIYKYFNRKVHALQGEEAEILTYDPDLPLLVSLDFNRSPATCILAQQRGNEIHIFQEFYQMDSDTWEISATVTDWISQTLEHNKEIQLFGDASGMAHTANSRVSNWDIVFDAFKDIGYTTVKGNLKRRFDKKNPPVINRINSMNCLFNKNRLFIDLDNCPELIKDFEMVSWSSDGIDKSDLLRSHLSDAAGYLVHTIFPFKQKPSKRHPSQQDAPVGLAA